MVSRASIYGCRPAGVQCNSSTDLGRLENLKHGEIIMEICWWSTWKSVNYNVYIDIISKYIYNYIYTYIYINVVRSISHNGWFTSVDRHTQNKWWQSPYGRGGSGLNQWGRTIIYRLMKHRTVPLKQRAWQTCQKLSENDTSWLVGGWPTPLKNMSSSMGRITSHILWKITNVWNHQPDEYWF